MGSAEYYSWLFYDIRLSADLQKVIQMRLITLLVLFYSVGTHCHSPGIYGLCDDV